MPSGKRPESQAKECQFSTGIWEPWRVQSKVEISSVDDHLSAEHIGKACRTCRGRTALETMNGALAEGGRACG